MAFSQSIKRGQAPATCNLCEEETKIKWKCVNCDMLMCTKCKEKIHVKFKFAKDHQVIDIKDVGDHLKTLDFSNLKCSEHTGQFAVMFCTTCDRLVCTSCISKIHNGHGLVEISDGYNIKLETIKTETTKAKEKIKDLTKEKGTISPVDTKYTKQYKDLILKIEAHNIEIKKSADKYTEELKSELKRKWIEFQVGKATRKIERVEDSLNQIILNGEALIQSKEAENVFSEYKKLSTAVSIDDIDPGTISFLPGQISPYNVGSLQVVSNAVNVRIVKQFQTDITKVLISLCPDNSLWISDQDVLQKVKPVEHELKVESTLNIVVYCMDVTLTGDLLLSSGGSVLKQISGKTGELTDSIYNVSPLNYSAVHVTKDGKVLVGVKSAGKTWPVTGRRAIIVMNQKGEHETIYEHDKNNIRIFTYVVRSITSTDNGNICVVDKLAEDSRGRVVVLNRDGDILQIYTGHHEINNENNPFKPVNIVTTPSDNIIVTELSSDIFHILNNCGHLITHFNMGDVGVVMPYSLSFTRTAGQLYIGCTRGVGSSEKGKLYEVHISGC